MRSTTGRIQGGRRRCVPVDGPIDFIEAVFDAVTGTREPKVLEVWFELQIGIKNTPVPFDGVIGILNLSPIIVDPREPIVLQPLLYVYVAIKVSEEVQLIFGTRDADSWYESIGWPSSFAQNKWLVHGIGQAS